jgi:hypothetical protein
MAAAIYAALAGLLHCQARMDIFMYHAESRPPLTGRGWGQ